MDIRRPLEEGATRLRGSGPVKQLSNHLSYSYYQLVSQLLVLTVILSGNPCLIVGPKSDNVPSTLARPWIPGSSNTMLPPLPECNPAHSGVPRPAAGAPKAYLVYSNGIQIVNNPMNYRNVESSSLRGGRGRSPSDSLIILHIYIYIWQVLFC